MVGVLVAGQARGEHYPRPDPPDDRGQGQDMGRLGLEPRVPVELDILERRPEQGRGPTGLPGPHGRGAVRRRFAPRADDQVRGATRQGLARDDPAARELDVVGVRAEGEQGRRAGGPGPGLRACLRSRLHRIGRWHPCSRK